MPEEPISGARATPLPLPSFAEPPLEEVVFGVQFEPLKQFTTTHPGLFWSRIRDRYPTVEDNPPLPHQKELPDLTPVPDQLQLRLAKPNGLRSWFIGKDKTQLVQLQRDQFLRNWRRVTGNEVYPRYATLRSLFADDWQEFVAFARDEGLGTPKIDQCELTYINHIDRGVGWNNYSDLGSVFTMIGLTQGGGLLSAPEVINWTGTYKLPDGRGRLVVEMVPAFRGRDLKMFVSLTLRVRGEPENGGSEAAFAWFELAHEWVVRAFDELTQPSMHAIWKKQS